MDMLLYCMLWICQGGIQGWCCLYCTYLDEEAQEGMCCLLIYALGGICIFCEREMRIVEDLLSGGGGVAMRDHVT
jgi:hypothetical protein